MRIIRTADHEEKDIVRLATKILTDGGLIIYPSDTCYGIGIDPGNKRAVDKLFKLKPGRVKPVSLAVNHQKMLADYISINTFIEFINDNFLPGAYTLVGRKENNLQTDSLDKRLFKTNNTLAFRIIDRQLINEVINRFGKPITSTSANPPDGKSSYSLDDILKQFDSKQKKAIDLIIDAGQLMPVPASLVLDTTQVPSQVIRPNSQVIAPILLNSVISDSPDKTFEFGRNLLSSVMPYFNSSQGHKIFLLFGSLGAGKTQLVKGFVSSSTSTDQALSPSFRLINEYQVGQQLIIHADLWRLENKAEIEGLKLENYFKEENIIFIEWAEKYLPFLSETVKKNNNVFGIYLNHLSQLKRELLLLKFI